MSLSSRVKAVVQLVGVGTPTLIAMARRGELGREQVWAAFKGAGACVQAMAGGDVASDVVADARVGSCDACGACVREVKLPGVEAMYCGRPLTGDGEGTGTCGCLVGVTIGGRVAPACKSMVRSETCGRGQWAT